jgi:hypothetical protein
VEGNEIIDMTPLEAGRTRRYTFMFSDGFFLGIVLGIALGLIIMLM